MSGETIEGKQLVEVQVNGVRSTWCAPNPITPLDMAEMMSDLKKVSRIMGKYKERKVPNVAKAIHGENKRMRRYSNTQKRKLAKKLKKLMKKGMALNPALQKLDVTYGTIAKYM